MSDEAASRPGRTRPTAESDAGQGAGPGGTAGSSAEPSDDPPERHSGRIVMRKDSGERLRKRKATADEKFLERPPATRPDFVDSDPWRALRILAEFVEGFDALAAVGPAVTIFGSARAAAGTPMYELARDIAHKLAASGFAIITGGGPGGEGGAKRGGRGGGGLSGGRNIQLPPQQ